MNEATFHYACAVDFRMRAARYRRLAPLYQPDVTAVLMSMADDLEAAADTLEDGNTVADRLRPAFAPHDREVDGAAVAPNLARLAAWPATLSTSTAEAGRAPHALQRSLMRKSARVPLPRRASAASTRRTGCSIKGTSLYGKLTPP